MELKNRIISPNPEDLVEPRLLNDKKTYIYTVLSSNATVNLIRKLLEYFNYDVDDFKIYLRVTP